LIDGGALAPVVIRVARGDAAPAGARRGGVGSVTMAGVPHLAQVHLPKLVGGLPDVCVAIANHLVCGTGNSHSVPSMGQLARRRSKSTIHDPARSADFPLVTEFRETGRIVKEIAQLHHRIPSHSATQRGDVSFIGRSWRAAFKAVELPVL